VASCHITGRCVLKPTICTEDWPALFLLAATRGCPALADTAREQTLAESQGTGGSAVPGMGILRCIPQTTRSDDAVFFCMPEFVLYTLGEAKTKASVFLRTVNAQYSFLLLLGGAADQAGARGVAALLYCA